MGTFHVNSTARHPAHTPFQGFAVRQFESATGTASRSWWLEAPREQFTARAQDEQRRMATHRISRLVPDRTDPDG